MKPHLTRKLYTCAAALFALTALSARATDLNVDFSGDVPGQPAGYALVDYSGGVDDSPCLKLTDGKECRVQSRHVEMLKVPPGGHVFTCRWAWRE